MQPARSDVPPPPTTVQFLESEMMRAGRKRRRKVTIIAAGLFGYVLVLRQANADILARVGGAISPLVAWQTIIAVTMPLTSGLFFQNRLTPVMLRTLIRGYPLTEKGEQLVLEARAHAMGFGCEEIAKLLNDPIALSLLRDGQENVTITERDILDMYNYTETRNITVGKVQTAITDCCDEGYCDRSSIMCEKLAVKHRTNVLELVLQIAPLGLMVFSLFGGG